MLLLLRYGVVLPQALQRRQRRFGFHHQERILPLLLVLLVQIIITIISIQHLRAQPRNLHRRLFRPCHNHSERIRIPLFLNGTLVVNLFLFFLLFDDESNRVPDSFSSRFFSCGLVRFSADRRYCRLHCKCNTILFEYYDDFYLPISVDYVLMMVVDAFMFWNDND